jgi:hypothetical protein
MEESRLAYPGWKVVLAGFFGVAVSFASIVPYTFGLFLKRLESRSHLRGIQHCRSHLGGRVARPRIPA